MTSLPNWVTHKAMIMKCQILLTAVYCDMHDSKQICSCEPEFVAEYFVFTNKGICFHFFS